MTHFIHTQKQKQLLISGIDGNVFKSIYTTVISNIQKNFRKGSNCIIDSVIEHKVNTSKYNPLAGSSYKITKRIRLSKTTQLLTIMSV